MSQAATPYALTEQGQKYAKAVLSGKVPACLYVRQACQRHLDELPASQQKRYPYYFDPAAGEKVARFASNMVHVKGEWAGKKILLEPWQCFLLTVLFGWKRKSDGLRRFRVAYIEIPRKNSKSTIGATIGLYMLAADNEPGAEVYSGATSEKQAWEVFGPARQMCLKNHVFKSHFGIHVGAKNLAIFQNASKFEPVIGNPGDGSSPHCALVDEYHEHTGPELYDTMLTGMGARSQPLVSVITTAGVDTSGPCYTMRSNAIKVLNGTLKNDELFTVIYTIDDNDDWTNWKSWQKANPNLGVSVYEDFLKARRTEALQSANRQNIIKCKHLNVWSNAGAAWINMVKWGNCASDLLIDEFVGEKCWIGLDFASKIDLTALIILFKRGDEYYQFCQFYIPEETVNLPENSHYQAWEAEGFLTATTGARADYQAVVEDIRDFNSRFCIHELAYDPREAERTIQDIREEFSFPCVEVIQSPSNISEPMKEMEALIQDGKYHHDDNPCMNWQASNVIQKSSKNKSYYPAKDKPENKIDGVVAGIMALSRAMLHEQPTASVYEDRGFVAL